MTKTARERLAFSIAEEICDLHDVDEGLKDDIYRTIATSLPLSYEELAQEIEKLSSDDPPAGERMPSRLSRLREALHCTPEMSLATVLDAAIDAVLKSAESEGE